MYYWYNNIIQPTPDSTHNTMVKTLSSRAIRLRYQGKNASSQDPGNDTEQGPRKRGRKKKKMHWQQLKHKAAEVEKNAASTSTMDTPPDMIGNSKKPAAVSKRSKNAARPPSRVTRSNPGPEPREPRLRKSPELFIAGSATSPRSSTHNPWAKSKENDVKQKAMIARLIDENKCCEKVAFESMAEISRLNAELTAKESKDPINRPLSLMRATYVENNTFKTLVGGIIKGSKKASNELLTKIMDSLGLNEKGCVADSERNERLARGIKELFEFHFESKTESQRGDILGHLLFDGHLFGKETGTNVACIVAASVTRAVFSPTAIAKQIDLKHGALNDTGVSDYARIQSDQNLFEFVRGYSLLPFRNRLTAVRKMMNDFAHYLFKIKFHSSLEQNKHGDFVKWDEECLLRFLVNEFKLTEKAATRGGVHSCITGDGATILGKYSNSQFATGIRILDDEAVDPKTGLPMFYDMVEDDDGRIRKKYKNYHTLENVAVTSISIKNETKQLLKDVFGDFFEFGRKIRVEGLLANGEEPRLLPFDIVICGDMCFLQKMTATGGACKVKKHFCNYCECHGDDDMFHVVDGKGTYPDEDQNSHHRE